MQIIITIAELAGVVCASPISCSPGQVWHSHKVILPALSTILTRDCATFLHFGQFDFLGKISGGSVIPNRQLDPLDEQVNPKSKRADHVIGH